MSVPEADIGISLVTLYYVDLDTQHCDVIVVDVSVGVPAVEPHLRGEDAAEQVPAT